MDRIKSKFTAFKENKRFGTAFQSLPAELRANTSSSASNQNRLGTGRQLEQTWQWL